MQVTAITKWPRPRTSPEKEIHRVRFFTARLSLTAPREGDASTNRLELRTPRRAPGSGGADPARDGRCRPRLGDVNGHPAPSAPFSGRRTAASCALRSVRHCTTTGGLGYFSDGAPTVSFATENQRSPRFLGEPLPACPALRPRWTAGSSPLSPPAMLPSARKTTSAPQSLHFGAQSRGLLAPCVRFADRLTPAPRNTRFRLVASLCRSGTFTRRVPLEAFRQIPSHDFLLLQASPGAPSAEACLLSSRQGRAPPPLSI